MITLIPEINLWTYRWFSLTWNIVINAVVSCAIRFAFHALSQLTLEFVTKHLTTANLKTNLESLLSGLEKKIIISLEAGNFRTSCCVFMYKNTKFPSKHQHFPGKNFPNFQFFPTMLTTYIPPCWPSWILLPLMMGLLLVRIWIPANALLWMSLFSIRPRPSPNMYTPPWWPLKISFPLKKILKRKIH